MKSGCDKRGLETVRAIATTRTTNRAVAAGGRAVDNSRAGILKRLRAKVTAGLPVIGGGAGTGISAKCEEARGLDLIVIYNSGRYRMAGRGSLAALMPYAHANPLVKDTAPDALTAAK